MPNRKATRKLANKSSKASKTPFIHGYLRHYTVPAIKSTLKKVLDPMYEYYNTGDDTNSAIWGNYRSGQTATPQVTYMLSSVKVKIRKSGAPPNDFKLEIYNTDGAGKPTGAVLAYGYINKDLIPTGTGIWLEATLNVPVLQTVGVMYARVGSTVGGSGSAYYSWRYDGTSATYPRGTRVSSSDGGATWTVHATFDMLFEDWGYPPIELPDVETYDATDIQIYQATLHGHLIDDGGEACDVRFEYGETIAYGEVTEWQTGKVSDQEFEATIYGLQPNTLYHFRAVAKNSAGTSYGADKQFTTQPLPPPPRTALVVHPALLQIDIYDTEDGESLYASHQALSSMPEQRLTRMFIISLPDKAKVKVTTLPGKEYTYYL